MTVQEAARQVLAELAVVAEAKAKPISAGAHGKPESRPPSDANLSSRRAIGPPSKERSLFDFYAWHMGRAESDQHLRILIMLARRDLEQRRGGVEHRAPFAGAFGAGHDDDTGQARDERIIAWYEGVHCLEAAVMESSFGYCSEANVRRVRWRAARDQDYGRPRSIFRLLSDDDKAREIERTAALSLQRAADRLGVAKRTVKLWRDRMADQGVA